MESLAESIPAQAAMSRFEDRSINLRKLIRGLAEHAVNEITDVDPEQLRAAGANSRSGY